MAHREPRCHKAVIASDLASATDRELSAHSTVQLPVHQRLWFPAFVGKTVARHGVLSIGQRNGFSKSLSRCLPAEGLSRSSVETLGHRVEIGLSVTG